MQSVNATLPGSETYRAARAAPGRRRRVAVLAAVVVVALAVLAIRWWTHPTLLRDLGDEVTLEPGGLGEVSLATTVIHPQVSGEPVDLTLNGVEAVFANNRANAKAEFSICHLSPGETPVGAVRDPANYCAKLEPLRPGASFHYGIAPESDYLLVTLTPTRRGAAHLTSVRINYSLGDDHIFRRGTQEIRVDRTVVAR